MRLSLVSATGLMIALLAGCAATPGGSAQTPPPSTQSPIENGPVAIGQTAYVGGPHVTPLEVIEDSRCPKGVMCVWAGQVKLRVRVTGGAWSRELVLISNKPVQVADGALQLVEVTPERTQGPGKPEEYRFTFRFDGGY